MKSNKFLRGLIGLTALPLVLSACAAKTEAAPQSAAPVAAPVETVTTAPAMRDARPALWVVKDADTTVYLFGTIHLLPKDVQWFKGPVKTAFDGSDALVLEMIEPPMGEMVQLLNKYGNATDGIKLSERMDADTRTNYEAAMKTIGIPAAAFEGKKPWIAYVTLYGMQLTKSGWDVNSGAEKILTNAAKGSNKPILALETAEEQFGILSGFSMEDQLAMLGQVVNEPESGVRELNKLLEYWMAGDADGIGAIMAEGMSQAKAVEHDLLTKRNANWTVWLDKKMDEPGTYFVAVGAAHLAGDNSVQNMLAKEGHIAVRVPN